MSTNKNRTFHNPAAPTAAPKNAPLSLPFYDAEDELVKTEEISVVRWGLLKKAIHMAKALDVNKDITDEDMDTISNFIVEVFNNRFTRQELEDGADISDVMSVFKSIVSRARALGNA